MSVKKIIISTGLTTLLFFIWFTIVQVSAQAANFKLSVLNPPRLDTTLTTVPATANNLKKASTQDDDQWFAYDSANQTLTLQANSSAAPTYDSAGNPQWPWAAYQSEITRVVIAGNITVQNGTQMFANLTNLKSISGLTNLDVSQNQNFTQMFANCPQLNELDLSNWDMQQTQDTTDMFASDNMMWKITLGPAVRFDNDPQLPVSPADGSEIPDGQAASATKIGETDWQEVGDGNQDFYHPSGEVVSYQEDSTAQNLRSTRQNKSGLYQRYQNDRDTYPSSAKTYVWQQDWWGISDDPDNPGYKYLKIYPHTIDIAITEVMKGDDAAAMWPWHQYRDEISRLQIKPGVKFTTGNNGTAKAMFSKMPHLKVASVHYLNTANCISFSLMFAKDTALTSVTGLQHWQTGDESVGSNTNSLTDTANMFNGCSNLQTISGIGQWNVAKITSSVNGMLSMFANCTKLQQLDLSGWQMSKDDTPNTSNMFRSDRNLWLLKLGDSFYFRDNKPPKIPAPPGNNTNFPDGSNAQSIDNYWRSVGSGDVHNPTGDLQTSSTLFALYKANSESHPTDTRTYVWNTAADYLYLNFDPTTIDFGTHKLPVSDVKSTKSFELSVNDYRPDRAGANWSVAVKVSAMQHDGDENKLADTTWHTDSSYNDSVRSEVVQSGTSNASETKYPLFTDGFPFYLHFNANDQPQLGQYHAQVTYSLTNDGFSTAIDPDDAVGSDDIDAIFTGSNTE
ncbi:BspA family leucine-rich repeat surface protein [Bombilactobacillus thymidiniphilus]|uniref:DUF285 domain-containing protein n=1 Tax=Bombilactobacillus thymidiniphilus TaxID=2923363 RepID=A0ABY4PC91_9LACO|nr:BspA family leucine-rich repeat surface protein [Bombilactobacillus thymidiniphilus]UQS83312.1 DUF285 domain-containing protein [Bombilactobacillus thymidiniphilus]